MRLDKFLSDAGVASRKQIKGMIKGRRVCVNGEVACDSAMHINKDSDVATLDGGVVLYQKYIYLMMNKPQGYLSATEDARQKTVIELLSDRHKAFAPFPAGRLDIDTEGFLLLTNDGDLAHRVMSPKKNVGKTYFAHVRGIVDEQDRLDFLQGVVLDDGYKTMPAHLEVLRQADVSEVMLTIKEGKFHQVKRMVLAVGKKVLYLKRMSIAGIELDSALELGQYRELEQHEVDALKKL